MAPLCLQEEIFARKERGFAVLCDKGAKVFKM